MRTLPFAASFDALAFIVRQIRTGTSHAELSELVPVLAVCFDSCSWEEETRRIIQHIPYEHFMLGWNLPQDVAEAVEVDIWGRKVFVHPATLERLVGKQLVVRALDAGGSKNTKPQSQILIAIARSA